jgi:serine/threonine protein kinase
MSRINIDEDANKTQSNVGPLKWMAPECVRHSQYSLKSDVWAFAVTIVEILTHDKPYPELQALQAVSLVITDDTMYVIANNTFFHFHNRQR